MATILDYLSSDHRVCDDLFASVEGAVAHRDWEGARRQLDRFTAAMLRHLAREEQVLFPVRSPHRQRHGADPGHAHGT